MIATLSKWFEKIVIEITKYNTPLVIKASVIAFIIGVGFGMWLF